MIEIRLLMNSAVEAVFGFKTCCGLQALDSNLEIQVFNTGTELVELPPRFDLEVAGERMPHRHLLPQTGILVGPGEIKAFYCQMDEGLWARAERLVLFDSQGGVYPVAIEHRAGDDA